LQAEAWPVASGLANVQFVRWFNVLFGYMNGNGLQLFPVAVLRASSLSPATSSMRGTDVSICSFIGYWA